MENIKHKHKDIVIKKIDGELVVTSRQVAEDFGKRHDQVLRDIEVYKNRISTPQFCGLFIESEYRASNGKMNKEYLLTRDGFSFLVMGFTGAKADEWKLKYIEAFNKMEQAIKNPYAHLSKEVQAIFALDHKQQQLAVEVKELKEGMPLFNVECKEIQAAVKRKGVEIVEAEICPDHVHMLVKIPPSLSVSSFVGYLKGKSTLMIFERHANLKYKYGNRHFWCRGYYVDTVGKNAKKIQEYIQNQLQNDLEYDQMTLKEYIDPFTGEPVNQNK